MCDIELYIKYRKGILSKEEYLAIFPEERKLIENEEEQRKKIEVVDKLIK